MAQHIALQREDTVITLRDHDGTWCGRPTPSIWWPGIRRSTATTSIPRNPRTKPRLALSEHAVGSDSFRPMAAVASPALGKRRLQSGLSRLTRGIR